MACVFGVAGVTGSCGVPTSLDSPESAARIRAMRNAAQADDESAVPRLIASLDSDDSAVRLFAIGSLQRITGERRGYDPFAPESERKLAVQEWREWYARSNQNGK